MSGEREGRKGMREREQRGDHKEREKGDRDEKREKETSWKSFQINVEMINRTTQGHKMYMVWAGMCVFQVVMYCMCVCLFVCTRACVCVLCVCVRE